MCAGFELQKCHTQCACVHRVGTISFVNARSSHFSHFKSIKQAWKCSLTSSSPTSYTYKLHPFGPVLFLLDATDLLSRVLEELRSKEDFDDVPDGKWVFRWEGKHFWAQKAPSDEKLVWGNVKSAARKMERAYDTTTARLVRGLRCDILDTVFKVAVVTATLDIIQGLDVCAASEGGEEPTVEGDTVTTA